MADSDLVPDRIWIVGVPCSGKSTLADELARRLGVDATHMDDLHFLPGWETRSDPEIHADLERIAAGERWVVDGNYSRFRRRFTDRTDLLVWLDLPFRRTFSRLLVRTFRRSLLKEPCCNGNRESLRRAFFHRESILWWAIKMHRFRRKQLEADLQGRRHVRLRSTRALAAWRAGFASRASDTDATR